MALKRDIYDEIHLQFGELVRDFVDQHVRGNVEAWEEVGAADRSLYEAAGEAGLLGFAIPEEYGGGGMEDFRLNAIMAEEFSRDPVSDAVMGLSLMNDLPLPYLLRLATPEQKQRWLPGIAAGTYITAIAMTEPGAGSDLSGIRTTAVRDGDHYIVNGSKTFISNGYNADLIVTVVRTSEDRHKGLSLLVVDASTPGFSRGKPMKKIGLHAWDTAELHFEDMRVPAEDLLGAEGEGFIHLVHNLPQERLSIAMAAVASTEGVIERAIEYVNQRKAFGRTIGSFQNTQFELADIYTATQATRALVDQCIIAHAEGALSAEDAAGVKFWASENHVKAVTRCLQLYGGYGYMREYRIARDFEDSRVITIYGGTTEIMKGIVGKGLGL